MTTDLREVIAAELQSARQRSLGLLEPLDDATLVGQHSPLMSPLVWDLAHIGNYEDQWLLRALGAPGLGDAYDDLYDAFAHPRRTRSALPILPPAEARAYDADVRSRVLDLLDRTPLDPDRPLLRDGFVYGMVVQHEHQHDETMLAALQLLPEGRLAGVALAPPAGAAGPIGAAAQPPAGADAGAAPVADEVLVAGGPFTMGTDTEPWAYDNERPAHTVDVPAFFLDTTAVTNRAYLAFVEEGGYRDRRWWTPEGWDWRREADLEHPQFWRREGPSGAGGSSWTVERFGARLDLPLDEAVQHVCWYEADAYARRRGRRLPTEAEWEKAASWDPVAGRKRRFPWGDEPPTTGRANLGQRRLGPAPLGAFPEGASPWGALGMVGDVWEWTSSDFTPHPGFAAFPYREYSEVFHGAEYKVLRGGSWATDPSAIRTTFRNWDYPIRRQIFAGFRCARDA